MAYHCSSGALLGISGLAIAIAGLACRAQAASPEEPAPPRLEAWSGGEIFDVVWSTHSGATWAPFGGVREPGFRVRAVVGAGSYRGGGVTFGDALIGHHRQLGPITLKIFGGITVSDHRPTEPAAMREGTALGAKALLETWWTITDQAWASADLSLALPHMHMGEGGSDLERIEYSSRFRLGWRLWPELSVGLEGGAGGPLAPTLQPTLQGSIARAGGFLRYEWAGGEISISGGVLVDGNEGEGQPHPFGTVSVLTRF